MAVLDHRGKEKRAKRLQGAKRLQRAKKKHSAMLGSVDC
jgi:hypothetical protein